MVGEAKKRILNVQDDAGVDVDSSMTPERGTPRHHRLRYTSLLTDL